MKLKYKDVVEWGFGGEGDHSNENNGNQQSR